ncbi:MAG TPA: ABC transporter permease subunit [Azospirillaceae bacterium]|nr:ABC transporter permease subunit [Azospirillaceae bacterium]
MLTLFAFGPNGWGDELLRGAGMTLVLAALGFALGLVFGTMGAAAKLSGSRILRIVAEAYTTVIRGVPELLVIYLFFFGSSGAIMFFARMFGHAGYVGVDAFTVGVLGLGVISGAYATEVIRGAFQAVPTGQIEAGRAIGMTRGLIFRRILLPQAARFALPGLGNVWQLVLKDSALVSVTALAELMRTASVAARSSGQPFTFYVAAGVLYLVLTTLSTTLFALAERRAGRGVVQVNA